MEDETQVAQTSEEQIEETTEETHEEESVEQLKERLTKAEELATNQRIRAEKAEKIAKEKKTEKKEEKDLSSLDVIHLSRANLADEDVERVVSWAKANNQTIAEALSDDDLKAVLKNREEKRKTDDAASIGSARRSPVKPVADKVVADTFKNDKIPEPGSPEAKALWEARVAARRG